jgi:histidine triad (HIT) family protein
MEDTIFTKIIRREIPAEIVYEDDRTIAFLDIAPVSPGHTLVVPKTAVRNVFETDESTWLAVMSTVRKIAPAVRDAVEAKGVHINSNHEPEAGQDVFHLHVHIIPRKSHEEFSFWPKQDIDSSRTKEIAERIRELL